jgi:hypothetical protein
MKHELHKLSHWQFVCHDDGAEAWSWRRAGPDGGIEASSEPMQNYGKAVADAIRHGFQPKSDSWTVHLARGSMHYPPRQGRPEELSAGRFTQPLEGAAERRRSADPRKRVTAVAVGVESDEIRVMFIIDGQPHIITERPGLTREQAELIAAGMANGLRAAALGYWLDEPPPDTTRKA